LKTKNKLNQYQITHSHKKHIRISMTTTQLSKNIQNQDAGKTSTSSVVAPHLIEAPSNDIDDRLNLFKGLYAVLPAYNEELVIGSVILLTRQYVDRVIVVDDGSSDRTARVAKLAGADVVRLEHNTGKAYALLLGLRRARETGCTVAVMLDADGQHDPNEIQRVARLVSIGKADLVIGSRFLNNNGRIPYYRQFGQKTLDLFTNVGAKTKFTDSQSGFRALSCQALDNLDFKSDGYNVESDMISHFSAMGLPIMEVPISVNYDVPHKHKMHPVTHGIGVFTRLINLILYHRPLLIFGLPGIFLITLGLFTGSLAFAYYYDTSKFSYGYFMITMLSLIMGMLFVISALLLHTLVMIVKDHRH
jgi:glycosyltransferase involved in cell wall biosynthesis